MANWGSWSPRGAGLERMPSGVHFTASDIINPIHSRIGLALESAASSPTSDVLTDNFAGSFPIFIAQRTTARPDTSSVVPRNVHSLAHTAQPTPAHTTAAPPKPAQTLCLPLLQVSVTTSIDSGIATTVLSQKFTNPTPGTIREASYTFPLYDGAVVTAFRCHVGESKVLDGVVKPKAQARREYAEAVEKLQAAALLEEHTPEVFETKLGNVLAHSTVRVDISYAQELGLDVASGGLVLTMPTSIAPRYGQPPDGYRAAVSTVSESGLAIQVKVNSPDPIRGLECRSHAVRVEMGVADHGPVEADSFESLLAASAASQKQPAGAEDEFDPRRATATLATRDVKMDKDFVLVVTTSGATLQRPCAVISPANKAGHAALAVTLRPSELGGGNDAAVLDGFEGEIVFLTDRSGSMHGPTMSAAIDALQVFLRSLPESCHFNIFSFGSNFSALWPASRAYDEESLDAAQRHVAGFGADMGGTNLLPALQSTVQHRLAGLENTQVIVLTDGETWNTAETLSYVARTRAELGDAIRFFALGIGNEVSHQLIQGIGSCGGGLAEVVAVDAQGRWQERVIQMLKAALTPNSLQVELDLGDGFVAKALTEAPWTTGEDAWSQSPADPVRYMQAPSPVPPLHPFTRRSIHFLLALGSAPPPDAVTVRLRSGADNTSFTETVLKVTPTQRLSSNMQALAARALLGDLKEHVAEQKTSDVAETAARENAEYLGMLYSVASKWTSFVAVERDEEAMSREIATYKAPMLTELDMLAHKSLRARGDFLGRSESVLARPSIRLLYQAKSDSLVIEDDMHMPRACRWRPPLGYASVRSVGRVSESIYGSISAAGESSVQTASRPSDETSPAHIHARAASSATTLSRRRGTVRARGRKDLDDLPMEQDRGERSDLFPQGAPLVPPQLRHKPFVPSSSFGQAPTVGAGDVQGVEASGIGSENDGRGSPTPGEVPISPAALAFASAFQAGFGTFTDPSHRRMASSSSARAEAFLENLDDGSRDILSHQPSAGSSPAAHPKTLRLLQWKDIVAAQTAGGLFELDDGKLEDLKGHFCRATVTFLVERLKDDDFLRQRLNGYGAFFKRRLNPSKSASSNLVLTTMLMIPYIQTHHAKSESLWELMVQKAKKRLPNVGRLLDPDEKDGNRAVLEWLEASMKHRHSAGGTLQCTKCPKAFTSAVDLLAHQIQEEHLDCEGLGAEESGDDTVAVVDNHCMSCLFDLTHLEHLDPERRSWLLVKHDRSHKKRKVTVD